MSQLTQLIYNSTPPTLTNGHTTQFQADINGNLKVVGAGSGGTQYAELTTTSPATGTLSLGRYQSSSPTLTNGQLYGLQLDGSGRLLANTAPLTSAADSVAAWLSDGTGNAISSSSGSLNVVDTTLSGAITSNIVQVNEAQVNGVAPTTGNGTTSTGTQRVTLSSDSTGQVKVTDGTNQLNVAANNSATTGNAGNFVLAGGTGYTTSTITLNSGSPNTAWFDLLNYSWIALEILTNTTPATLTFETSNDSSQTNINDTSLSQANTNTNALVPTSSSTNATFHGPRTGRYFRVASNNGAGSTTLVLTFFTVPSALQTIGVAAVQSGTWTVQSELAAQSTGGYTYKYIAAGQATTVVKNAAGTLHSITFNGAATATNTTTLYDNASGSGTVIGIPAATSVTAPTTVIYDIAFANGLTIITGTANGADMTVAFK